jgi:hypothetical protein
LINFPSKYDDFNLILWKWKPNFYPLKPFIMFSSSFHLSNDIIFSQICVPNLKIWAHEVELSCRPIKNAVDWYFIFWEKIINFQHSKPIPTSSMFKYLSNGINFTLFWHPELKLWPPQDQPSTTVNQSWWENLSPWIDFRASLHKIRLFGLKFYPTCIGMLYSSWYIILIVW